MELYKLVRRKLTWINIVERDNANYKKYITVWYEIVFTGYM